MIRTKSVNMARRISYRQMLFCQMLLRTSPFSPKKAAIMAGYSPKNAKQIASRLLNSPIVQCYRNLYYQELRSEIVPEPEKKRTKLTARQWLFMFCYMSERKGGKPMSGKDAAINAGYSPASARQIASRLLKHPEIKYYIEQGLGERKTFRELRDRVFATTLL
jgi:phage terminase small subunit